MEFEPRESTIEIERLTRHAVTDDNRSCRDILAKVVTKEQVRIKCKLKFVRERITVPYCRFSFIVKYRRGVF